MPFHPRDDQIAEMATRPDDEPVFMLNPLRFREYANDGPQPSQASPFVPSFTCTAHGPRVYYGPLNSLSAGSKPRE